MCTVMIIDDHSRARPAHVRASMCMAVIIDAFLMHFGVHSPCIDVHTARARPELGKWTQNGRSSRR
jgi:hypothetical protein